MSNKSKKSGANLNGKNSGEITQITNPLAESVIDQPTDQPTDQPAVDSEKEKVIADAKKAVLDAESAFADAKTKLAEAKSNLKKLIGGKATKESKGPGVISTILSLVTKAPKKGISKSEILTKLTEMFPDRATEGMEKTINVQLPKRMSKERGINIVKLENGNFYVEK